VENEAKFYRIVKIVGLYDKSRGNADEEVSSICSKVSFPANCDDTSSPKELRFCVKVFYVGAQYGSSELCSMMTNFKE
jgi:hypothetical protein